MNFGGDTIQYIIPYKFTYRFNMISIEIPSRVFCLFICFGKINNLILNLCGHFKDLEYPKLLEQKTNLRRHMQPAFETI